MLEPNRGIKLWNEFSFHLPGFGSTHMQRHRMLEANHGTKFEKLTPEQKEEVVIVHNNFIQGKDKKKARFVKNDLWKLSN